jgi:hypothetical protein
MPISPRISPLRRRMIEDMTVRQFVEKTQADYIRHIRTAFLGRSPDIATADDLRRFQLAPESYFSVAFGVNDR